MMRVMIGRFIFWRVLVGNVHVHYCGRWLANGKMKNRLTKLETEPSTDYVERVLLTLLRVGTPPPIIEHPTRSGGRLTRERELAPINPFAKSASMYFS